jgi:hypothetical protein
VNNFVENARSDKYVSALPFTIMEIQSKKKSIDLRIYQKGAILIYKIGSAETIVRHGATVG